MASYPFRGLRVRLAVAVAASYAFLLAFAAVILYLVLQRQWYAEVDANLAVSARAASAFFSTELVEYGSPEATVVHIVSELVFGDRTIVALDSAGRRIARSRPIEGAPDLWSSDLAALADGPITVATAAGPCRVIPAPLAKGFRLAIGFPLTPVEQRLANLRAILTVVSLLCLGLGSVVALATTRRVLAPVNRLAGEADRVGQALAGGGAVPAIAPQTETPDEVGRLEAAFVALINRLNDALGKEREAAASQRRFFADAAHELRTPLAILRNQIDAALQVATAPERAVLEPLGKETEHLGRLVGDLLLLARGETAGDLAGVGIVGLDDLTGAAIVRAGRHPAAAGRQIAVGEFDTAPVKGDRTLLERAVLALLENALLHAAPSDVHVSVGVNRANGRPTAWVRVSDDGPPIPDADRARIFERFVRLRRDVPGSGLGLAIVGRIAALHGGGLSLAQPDGEHAKSFVLEMPLAEP